MRLFTLGSAIGARTWLRRSSRCAGRSAIRRRSGSTRLGVHQSRPRPLGLRQGGDARLLSAREAHRQCVCRSLQQPRPGRVHERPLVLTLADDVKSWRLGADTTTRSDRTAPSATRCRFVAETRRRSQPVAVTKAGKTLASGAPKMGAGPNRPENSSSGVQQVGPDQTCRGSNRRWMTSQWQVKTHAICSPHANAIQSHRKFKCS